MKILTRYILSLTLKNLLLSLMVFTLLFLVIDFFEHFDNIVGEGASVISTAQYFLFKIPLTVSLMLPVAMLLATMLTLGLLSKNSEITAMRAAGLFRACCLPSCGGIWPAWCVGISRMR